MNVDREYLPEVQHCVDFDKEPLPFGDDSVDEIYSSHALEHLLDYRHLLHEIVRVAIAGARVEIRVPHWLQSMAMCQGHRQTISPTQVRHWVTDFIDDWWGGCKKRLALVSTEFIPGETFFEAKRYFAFMPDEAILRLIPDACHEVCYVFLVVENK